MCPHLSRHALLNYTLKGDQCTQGQGKQRQRIHQDKEALRGVQQATTLAGVALIAAIGEQVEKRLDSIPIHQRARAN